jgi:nucleoside-diphosphate-sugar epimerase
MKIFMTGSSGFIGSHLTNALRYNHEIYHLASDLLDFDGVMQEVEQQQPDIIVHLAARTEVESSFYEQTTFSQVNYVGTVNLIEAAARVKTLKNFVFASTMEVYGWQPISDEIKFFGKPKSSVVFDNHTIPNPNAPYAIAKFACEKYLEYAGRCLDLPYTILRQTNCYGRKDNDFFVTEQIITQMLSNPDVINLGYGEPYRNFIHVDDMLGAWKAVITNPDKCNHGVMLTLGPNSPIKISDYVSMIAAKLDWTGKVNWNTKRARPGEIYWLNSDNNKITALLGWKPTITLDNGIDQTIAVWREKLQK